MTDGALERTGGALDRIVGALERTGAAMQRIGGGTGHDWQCTRTGGALDRRTKGGPHTHFAPPPSPTYKPSPEGF